MYAAAPEPKRLLLIEGGNHSNFGDQGAGDYQRALEAFVALAQSTVHERVARTTLAAY
jgi:hypothetical protein